jgi:hypothetical protein
MPGSVARLLVGAVAALFGFGGIVLVGAGVAQVRYFSSRRSSRSRRISGSCAVRLGTHTERGWSGRAYPRDHSYFLCEKLKYSILIRYLTEYYSTFSIYYVESLVTSSISRPHDRFKISLVSIGTNRHAAGCSGKRSQPLFEENKETLQ